MRMLRLLVAVAVVAACQRDSAFFDAGPPAPSSGRPDVPHAEWRQLYLRDGGGPWQLHRENDFPACFDGGCRADAIEDERREYAECLKRCGCAAVTLNSALGSTELDCYCPSSCWADAG